MEDRRRSGATLVIGGGPDSPDSGSSNAGHRSGCRPDRVNALPRSTPDLSASHEARKAKRPLACRCGLTCTP